MSRIDDGRRSDRLKKLDRWLNRRRPRSMYVAQLLQAAANVAMVVVAVIALGAQLQSSTLENFFRSEIVTRNEEITGLAQEKREREAQLKTLNAEVSSRQQALASLESETVDLRVSIERWEQGAAQQQFLASLSVPFSAEMWMRSIDAIRSDRRSEVYAEKENLGADTIARVRAITAAAVRPPGVAKKVTVLRDEFLDKCGFIGQISYVPPGGGASDDEYKVFSDRSKERSRVQLELSNKTYECAMSLPSYNRSLDR